VLRRPSPAMVVAFIALMLALAGTAYAAATIVNIADPTNPANVAKVDTAGRLATTAAGTVNVAAPAKPFSFPAASFPDGGATIQFGATTATVAFTGFRVANQSSVSTTLTIYQYGEPNSLCSTSSSTNRFLGQFSVPAGTTVDEQLTTAQIVKPLSGSPYWCFVTFANGPGGSAFWTTYSGYVVSGTFPPPGTAVSKMADATARNVTRADLR
jgi:hypothetical protein